MNPIAIKIAQWCVNLIILIAAFVCIYLGLFLIWGTDGTSYFNRLMCVLTGLVSLAFDVWLIKVTISRPQ